MKKTLVSIIIPTYNRAHLIGETLNSIIAQTYTNWECIIVDDGSTDNTNELVSRYCEKDNRIHYCHRPNDRPKGSNSCRNYGFKLSSGDYINWLDSDDLLSDNKIDAQIKILQEGQVDIAICKWGRFKNNIYQASIYHNEPYYKNYSNGFNLLNSLGENGNFFPPHVYLVDRNLIKRVGFWDETLKINQDAEFFCRVLLNCKKIAYVSDAIVYYRENSGDNISTTETIEKMELRIKSWAIIENHIKRKTKIHNSKYVYNAKEFLFSIVLKKYPILIRNYKWFFKEQILKHLIKNNKFRYYIKKIIKRLKKINL